VDILDERGSMTNLFEALKGFQDLTKTIIHDLREDEVDKLLDLIEERQQIIKVIQKLQYNTNDFELYCKNFNIMELEQEAVFLIQDKMKWTQNEIKKVQSAKSANNDYNREFYKNIKLFDKQV